ncbi:MAG: esterase-like activity of phytase family protein [bacterium]|nr:esterase-like activity of phytase family protein [bacterium]
MKPNLTIKIVLSLFFIAILNKSVNAQITVLQDYKNYYAAPIGTFQGIKFKEGGLSGIYPIPNTNGKEFWVLSDRGMNVDAANANPSTCRPTYDKIYGFPTYAPKIHRIKINGDSIQILKTIAIRRPGGTTASGIINPTGFGSTALEVASTDTVLNCANFTLKTTPKDIWGIDCEGIVVDKDGNFWICEEGGPSIWKVDPNGVVINRFTPYAKKVGAQPQDIYIDSCFGYRKNNRGFEGISITPNGKIYAMIQSPLLYPTQSIGEGTRVHRMLEIDPVTNSSKMFIYLNDGIIGASGSNQIRLRDWKIGDMAAINDSTFLIIEHAVRGTTDRKNIYSININGASAINSGLYSTKTIEALVDSTGLAANSIKPVKKKLFMNLMANGWPAALDKPEGLAIINDSTIAVSNDNDYGQASLPQDGIAVATSTLSHVFTYGLKGNNKISNFRNGPSTGALPSSSQTPYLEGIAAGVKTNALLTVGDAINGYKMVGIPDGLGAYDNNNGTFTLLMNHELSNSVGITRAHGSKGAFVSKWVINKSTLAVVSGSDLITKVKIWSAGAYKDSTTSFNRFCSADLPPVSAFYNAATGLGTQERIFMNGEESGSEGRAFGHIATGANAGTTYELPYLGKFSWENSIASPFASNKTMVAGTDDATPGQVYFYIGTKTNTGTEIEKAGLSGGKLFGVKVTGLTTEVSTSIPSAGTAFTLFDLGQVQNTTGAALNTASGAAGVTTFLRPEDGAWDPSNPNDFYFATTNSFTAPSRLWRLRFTDIANPENGGTITAVLDGTEGPKMIDNIGFDKFGHIMLQEDVGNNVHIGKIWQYTIATDAIKLIAQHDANRFIIGGSSYLTQDEESSGILDMQDILGAGMFIYADQAHYGTTTELVEGGQLLTLYNPDTYNASKGAGPSSSQTPYLEGVAAGVKTNALLTVGDSINGYKMVGIPDGLGAYDNNNGTFTLLMNHELSNSVGITRAHGSKGAFVSKWVINKSTLAVVSGSDLITKVKIWSAGAYKDSTTSFNRFCSADLPPVSAFYNAATGLGTQERIFMNGEESGSEGRAFGHIATGANAGTTYELPYLGKFSWENSIASPFASNKTMVAGTDDATPGQVYFYIGTKTNTGTEIEKAGLSGGKLFGVKVTGLTTEVSTSIPSAGTAFTLFDLGQVQNTTGAALNTASGAAGVTTFLRPEDGAWDPSNPNDFYFATTNSFTAPSRLWRLRFTDIANPENGGTITAVLDGTEGPKMIDNIGFDKFGHIMLQEDVGNNVHIGKIWQYTIATDAIKLIAQHDANRFIIGGSSYLTQDEESSGILDMQDILGAGMFIYADQAHYGTTTELVEGGQLLTLYNPDTYNANPEVSVKGNKVNIAKGDITPSIADNTDFGTLNTATSVNKTFVIKNAGPGALILNNISFSGTNASEFSIIGAPTYPANINASDSLIVTVKFAPLADGLRSAKLTIANNDADENSYDFTLQGTAVSPEINIQGNSVTIASGSTTPNLGNNTDFGTVNKGSTATKSFVIQNTGAGSLTITSFNFTGANASEFSIIGQPSLPLVIAANGSQTITVQFAPNAAGVRTATMNVASNDADEAAYTFALQGNGNTSNIDELLVKNTFVIQPNPFEVSTTVKLNLVSASNVKVEVYNILGECIETIENTKLVAGNYSFILGESSSVYPTGVYLVKVVINGNVITRKIVKGN